MLLSLLTETRSLMDISYDSICMLYVIKCYYLILFTLIIQVKMGRHWMLTAPFDDREKGRYFLPDSGILVLFCTNQPLLSLPCWSKINADVVRFPRRRSIPELPIIRLARAVRECIRVIAVLSPEQGEQKNSSQGNTGRNALRRIGRFPITICWLLF